MTPSPITIRRTTTQDAAAFARIMGDLDVLPGLMQQPYTSTEVWQARLAKTLQEDDGTLRLSAERHGVVVGCAGLHPATQQRRRHAAGIGIAVAGDAQGQGVGTALMQALCDYADGWSQLLRLELTVFTDNLRAVRLYERMGFSIDGTLRGYALRDGVFADVHTMSRWHANPPALRRTAA